jgi:hypothetical protein
LVKSDLDMKKSTPFQEPVIFYTKPFKVR